jgi:HlyD family secretion protein
LWDFGPGRWFSHRPSRFPRFLEPQEQPTKRTGLSYFTIRIGMTAQEIAPGMPVEAFVQTGERTMISYLMKPLHDQLMRARDR